ncbi:uncharacterized protein B0I36DRAFT_49664 [Microdochium trichocladiopsis]|uniref:PD-(D/E)XK nuclease-like domain-containing protein n=1 Tax=Microdochium trichocladiopsis TaxID=1682393 RepID=A0A9P9BLT0_9PEZI|nr:uncharacterized protein B0I36DRAFT_49664 [Microdochium trichocladiopsis]KAH7014402.1 hypothetical protein B0I36DRAFT_49664 [Microdochium trichocladiopsis]
MDTAAVHHWLSSIPTPTKTRHQHPQQHPPPSKKRARGLVSPPMSTDRDSSPPKRRRQADNSVDNRDDPFYDDQAGAFQEEATPRPARSLRLSANDAPSIASSASSASHTTSRSSSPRKQLAGLRTLPAAQGGAEVCTLDIEDDRMPADLADLVLALQSRSPLLCDSMRDQVQAHYRDTRAARQWRDPSLFAPERRSLGHTPQPAFADDIVRQARECDRYMLDEAAWSSMVYYPLLREIFAATRSSQGKNDNGDATTSAQLLADFAVVPCSSASIIPRYRMLATPFKKVDFAVAYHPREEHINREAAPPSAPRHDKLKTLMQSTPSPDQSLNHTSYPGLCDRPVVLSIEVKRTNDSADTAKLQLLTWLSAQWNKMDELCPDALESSSLSSSSSSPAEPTKPTYLLALLIQGHDWSLVASSREPKGKRVILWHKLPIGDTQTAMGVYKIVQQVQQLASIAMVPYCRWFQALGG